ncbi:MAG: hypothetical protein Q7S52_01485 [bacterium]|nr:hypothetical protein [bacterium]
MKSIVGFLAVALALAAPVAYADRGDHNRNIQRRDHGGQQYQGGRRVEQYRGGHYAPRHEYRAPHVVIERPVYRHYRAPRVVIVPVPVYQGPYGYDPYYAPARVYVERPRYEYWRADDGYYYRIQCRNHGLGIVAGVVVGAVIGNAIAGDLGAVIGGLGGAVIGSEIDDERVCR